VSNKSTILIVDDQLSARELLKGLLMQDKYNLAFATNGPEALGKIEQVEPDVILLDVMMPGMSGFEVCQRLKSDEQWQHVPIILVTALDSKEHLVQGLDAGADDFLHKPINGLELRARVRSMLRIKNQFDELQATLTLREELAHMVVHDMRTPLTAIVGFTELLKQGIITSEDTGDIDKLYRQVLQLNSLVTELLTTAKMEQNQLLLNRSLVDLQQLIQSIQDDHAMVARSKNIKLTFASPSKNSQKMWLDVNLFRRVVDNLISNALKFSPSSSTVSITIEYPEVTVQNGNPPKFRLKVLDEGPGIPAEYREVIFDKFKIIDLKHQDVPQIGLGLAFCKLVVDAHEGRIFVEDNQPKGSIFTVEI